MFENKLYFLISALPKPNVLCCLWFALAESIIWFIYWTLASVMVWNVNYIINLWNIILLCQVVCFCYWICLVAISCLTFIKSPGYLSSWAPLLIGVYFYESTSAVMSGILLPAYLYVNNLYRLRSLISFIAFSRARELEKLLPLEQYL